MPIVSGSWRHGSSHTSLMPAPHSSFARLRFAPASSRSGARVRPRLTPEGTLAVPEQLGVSRPRLPMLDVPRTEGLDLLDWLGLGRPDFGAIPARELAPLCRRRLWAVRRNDHASLKMRTTELLAVAEEAGEGMVLFG